jgi:hypothetical protein
MVVNSQVVVVVVAMLCTEGVVLGSSVRLIPHIGGQWVNWLPI